jgi:glycosyltransferase involved in cell wall biosynthesis
VDTAVFRAKEAKPSNDNVFTVIYAGILGLGYDFEQIFSAAQILKERKVKVQFILHGRGECASLIQERITQLKIDNAKLHQEVFATTDELVTFMNSADALVLPLKKYETPYPGLPTKLYEYQSMGKPIICCADGQPADFMVRTKSGIVTEPGNSEQLAEAITFLLNNKAAAKTMGANGRKYVEENESITIVGTKLKYLLQNLLKQ